MRTNTGADGTRRRCSGGLTQKHSWHSLCLSL
jgi:hypothetical protein